MEKKVTKKRIVIACGVIILTLAFILNMPFFSLSLNQTFLSVMNLPTNRIRARLLYKTDYQALLVACREVLEREDLVAGMRYEPSKLRLPNVIRKLGPTTVIKDKNYLNIYIRGFMDRFGVYAYPEDFEAPKGYTFNGKELIPGLWYYDEGIGRDSDYDKWIETFIQKGKN